MTKKRPIRGLECVSCLGAAQFAGVPGAEEIARKHDHGGPAVVIHKGTSYCEEHWNISRGFPPGFPEEPLPDELQARIMTRYRQAQELLDTAAEAPEDP